MTEEFQPIVPTWVLIGAAIFAFVAIADLPYGYYRLLRWIICAVTIAASIDLHRASRTGWVWALGALAVIFNPFFPIYFERGMWRFFDAAAGCLLLGVVFLTRKQKQRG